MYQLLTINYIYQINANLSAFNEQFVECAEFLKPLRKEVIKIALLLSKDYESCQAIAYLERLTKHET